MSTPAAAAAAALESAAAAAAAVTAAADAARDARLAGRAAANAAANAPQEQDGQGLGVSPQPEDTTGAAAGGAHPAAPGGAAADAHDLQERKEGATDALAEAIAQATLGRARADALAAEVQRLTRLAATAASSLAAVPPAEVHKPERPRGPLSEKYKGEGGLQLDAWIRSVRRLLAFFSDTVGTTAVTWLATGLEGAAADWFDEREVAFGRPPATPDMLFAELRKRFQPVNSAETARHDLDKLRQTKGSSVNDYTTRFRQLVTHLPADSVQTRMFQYRRGLQSSIEERLVQAEPQPATLDETIAMAARIEGRAGASSRSDGLAAADLGVEGAVAPPTLAQINALLEQAVARGAAAAQSKPQQQPGGRKPYDSRRDRGANQRSDSLPLWKAAGLTWEEGQRRRSANLCMHCGKGGHIYRECPDRIAGKPASSN